MTSLESYNLQRENLLARIVETLSKDERFAAGWLTGSFSRDEADAFSDIDLTLVVTEQASDALCIRFEQVSAQTTPERFSLFGQFGTPALIHENNNNAPEGGTFTFVMYAGSATMIDWVLIPQNKATRPYLSRLLFDKVGISISSPPKPEDAEQSKKYIAEQWAFFWMMTAITIKYVFRGDSVFVTEWLENLHQLAYEIERQLNREAWKYKRGSHSMLQPTREKQIESIRQLCQRILELKPQISEFTGSQLATPLSEIETLLSLVNNRQS